MKSASPKIIVLLIVSVAVVAATIVYFDPSDRILGLFRQSDASFTSSKLCTWDHCLDDNRSFIQFLETNQGSSAMVDFQIDIPFGAGEFQSECYGKLVLSHPHDGADEMILAVLPSFDQCFPPGAVFLRVMAEDIMHVTAVTGNYTDRVSGIFSVSLSSYADSPMYTLVRNQD